MPSSLHYWPSLSVSPNLFRFSGAQVLYRLHPEQQETALKLLTDFTNGTFDAVSLKVNGFTSLFVCSYYCSFLQQCIRIHKILESGSLGDCKGIRQKFFTDCHSRYPLSTSFHPLSVAIGEDCAETAFAKACSAKPGSSVVKERGLVNNEPTVIT